MPRPQENPVWFQDQYLAHQRIIYNRCRVRAGHEQSEDATSHAFAKAWETNKDFPCERALVVYLVKSAENYLVTQGRKARCHRMLLSYLRTSGYPAGSGRAVEYDRIRSAFLRLGQEEQDILNWYYRDGLGDQSIAEKLGSSRPTSLRRRHKALRRLKGFFLERDGRGDTSTPPNSEKGLTDECRNLAAPDPLDSGRHRD